MQQLQFDLKSMSGKKHSSGPHKYNKVNQQKKFHLLTLIFKEKKSIRQAAQIVGINYLTAKTIVFFHKNNYKSYQFDIQKANSSQFSAKSCTTTSYANLKNINSLAQKLFKPKTRIQVICSIGNVLSPPVERIEQVYDEGDAHQMIIPILNENHYLASPIPQKLFLADAENKDLWQRTVNNGFYQSGCHSNEDLKMNSSLEGDSLINCMKEAKTEGLGPQAQLRK